MKKWRTYLVPAAAGLVYGLVAVLLSRLLIRNLGGVFSFVNLFAKLEDGAHIVLVLSQLKQARLVSPWVAALLLGLVAGLLFFLLIHRCKRKVRIACWVWIPLLLPLTLAVVLFTTINDICPAAFLTDAPQTPVYQAETYASEGENWHFGYGRRQILPDESSDQPLYIAGYNFGVEITEVRDYCEARAVWLDTGEEGVLLIGIDCVGLDSGTVSKIREQLADLPGCASVNVYSTHTHAGADTLGLWGPKAVDGKNDAYMAALVQAAAEAGREAAANPRAGTLYLGQTRTTDMFRDSRTPQIMDENLYQLRFAPEDGGKGLRLYFYGAHAEALRSANTRLSRDFPGILCDEVTAVTGDDTMFFPGAIGGLIMTKEFVDASVDGEENLTVTADKLVTHALTISEEKQIPASMALSRQKCVVPMDNIVFLICKALGVLDNQAVRVESATGYGVETELAVLRLDDLGVALIPGEIFPELVYGVLYGDANPEGKNPEPLMNIAAQYGITKLLVVGLSNDEIGYIVPPSDYLLNEKMPYLERTMDYKGEDHYEETNSIGPECAQVMADTFGAVLQAMEE